MAPAMIVPVMKKPVVVVEKTIANASSAQAPSVPMRTEVTRSGLPQLRPAEPAVTFGNPDPGSLTAMGTAGWGGGGDPLGLSTGTGERVVVAAPKKPEVVKVSAGVAAGMLLGGIRPVYPRIAIVAHQQGVVVIEATISKLGTIESARVTSGPAMLAGAALDAVKQARYRPYRLNGEATEVQTTITVNFRLGDG